METYQWIHINNDEGKTSEVSWGCDIRMGVNMKNTKEWILGEGKEDGVIWCCTTPFWHLVTGSVGMKVKGVWVSGNQWNRQCKRWWPDMSWYDGGRGTHLE